MSKYIPKCPEAEAKARELVGNEKDLLKRYEIVTHWVRKNILYDLIRAVTIPKRGREFPNVERCWKQKAGICMDVSAMTVGMLRAVGVNAYMVYGHTEKTYHAWVEAHIKNKVYRFDHSGKARKYNREKVFT